MATITSDTTVTNTDGSTTRTVTYGDGSVLTTWTPAANSTAANQQALQAKAQAALTANATYLAIASPTTAQTLAQVQTLTKECNALIRLALGLLDSTSGT